MKQAKIYMHKNLAGILVEDENGFTFTYDSTYLEMEDAIAISLSLPLQKEAFVDKVGMYDETLRIVSDYKWYFDAVLNHNALVAFTDIYVSYFDNTGISSTNLTLDKAERRQVLEQMLPPAVLADYDRYHLAIDQNERLKGYPLLYKFFYFVERVLFKFDKWNMKYWSWKKK